MDIVVDDDEAPIVKKIFEMTVKEATVHIEWLTIEQSRYTNS